MAIKSSGSYIKFSEIETEFGQNTNRDLGEYRVSQTIGGLVNQPLDTGIPSTGEIKFSDFYNKKLNIVIDYHSGTSENRPSDAYSKYSLDPDPDPANTGSRSGYWDVIGGFKNRPGNSSGSKVRIHVNKTFGSEQGEVTKCAVRTGSSWNSGTDLTVEVGSAGQIYGSGGNGGEGGTSSSSPDGEDGRDGSSGLGIEYAGTTITNNGIIMQGYGGGGGGGYRKVEKEEWWGGPIYSASGGGGGGGAGNPGGSSGGSTQTNAHWSTTVPASISGSWSGTGSVPSGAAFVVRDYNTGNFTTLFDGISGSSYVEFTQTVDPITQNYKFVYNGTVMREGATNVAQVNRGAWQLTRGDIVTDTTNLKTWKIKVDFKDSNNTWRFYVDGSSVGTNTTGNDFTSGNARYAKGSLESDTSGNYGLSDSANPAKVYKIITEAYTGGGHSGGGGSGGSLSTGGSGGAGATEDQAIGGEGGHGADSEQGAESGEKGSYSGEIEQENSTEGDGGNGGGTGVPIRRSTSNITFNLINNGTIGTYTYGTNDTGVN